MRICVTAICVGSSPEGSVQFSLHPLHWERPRSSEVCCDNKSNPIHDPAVKREGFQSECNVTTVTAVRSLVAKYKRLIFILGSLRGKNRDLFFLH